MTLASLLRWWADLLDPQPPGPEIVAVVDMMTLPLGQRVNLLLPWPRPYQVLPVITQELQGRN